jgi:methylaspartate ammonia-lyase
VPKPDSVKCLRTCNANGNFATKYGNCNKADVHHEEENHVNLDTVVPLCSVVLIVPLCPCGR